MRLGVVAARVRRRVVRVAREGPFLEALADERGARPLRELGDLEVADLDHRLVRGIVLAPGEPRRELLEGLVEIPLPEPVGLHRVEVAVEDLEPAFHGLPPARVVGPRGRLCQTRPSRGGAGARDACSGRPRPYNRGSMSLLLEARGLVKHLGGKRVVDGVDLTCEAGQILGLLGPNGAGKTTTLRMLYGFLRPDAGRIHVNGVELGRDLVRAKRAIGVCTQDDTFDGDFTVEQNLTIAASYFRPRPDGSRPARARADRALRPRSLREPEARDALGRLSAPAHDRARPRAPAAPALPRRAHHRASTRRRAWACGISSTACARRGSASSSPRTTWTRPSG